MKEIMKFFINTANPEDIKKAYKVGILFGVTIKLTLIAKDSIKFETRSE